MRPHLRTVTLGTALLLVSCDSPSAPGEGSGPTSSATPLAVAGNHSFVALSAGSRHTCGLTADGATLCWGDNSDSQLGTVLAEASLIYSIVPVRVQGNHRFVAISTGSEGSCGLTAEGALYCWGTSGPICTGAECRSTPTLLEGAPAFVAVSTAGWRDICGLTGSGDVYCSSSPNGGFAQWHTTSPVISVAVGRDETRRARPCLLTSEGEVHCGGPAPLGGGHRFRAVGAGEGYGCGITEGTVYCWGNNRRGQLGRGFWSGDPYAPEPPDFWTPAPVAGDLTFSSIAVGPQHSCALTPQGVAYCWGSQGGWWPADERLGHGQAQSCAAMTTWNGLSSSELCDPTPRRVSGEMTFVSLSAGGTHTCALTTTGQAYCWGSNHAGQLGMGKSP